MENYHGLWEIAILALLREGPMHPYQMQSLLRERHKDKILVLKRGSLYHAINRLLRSHLIEAVSSGRDGRRPERTTYRILQAGQQQLLDSLREMVKVPQREPSAFLAGMSFLVYLTPDDATAKLTERAGILETEIQATEAARKAAANRVHRINLIESEYLVTMRRAELLWVGTIIGELRSEQLTWNLQEILKAARAERKPAAVRARAVQSKIRRKKDDAKS
jgi:DNA-binding PadR family transcriptional regulator